MEHFRIDLLKDIILLERGIDMIFRGFNPSQYAREYIFQNGEKKERYEIECTEKLWQEIAGEFGTDAMVVKKGFDNITVRISAISSQMRSWILAHMDECEVISPRRFREEIQRTIMDAYRKYCM